MGLSLSLCACKSDATERGSYASDRFSRNTIERDRKNPQMAELSKSIVLNRNAMNYLRVRMHGQVYLPAPFPGKFSV